MRKAVAEMASGAFESSVAERNQPESLVTVPSKSPRIKLENLDEKNIFEKRNNV